MADTTICVMEFWKVFEPFVIYTCTVLAFVADNVNCICMEKDFSKSLTQRLSRVYLKNYVTRGRGEGLLLQSVVRCLEDTLICIIQSDMKSEMTEVLYRWE